MTQTNDGRSALATYARDRLRGEGIYRDYRPRTALLEQVGDLLPSAHAIVVSGPWCGDCRREVPKFARIVEQLPAGWTVELRGDDADTRELLAVRAIPTFLIQDQPGGRELGRIIEAPSSGEGLEGDLLAIAESTVVTDDGQAA